MSDFWSSILNTSSAPDPVSESGDLPWWKRTAVQPPRTPQPEQQIPQQNTQGPPPDPDRPQWTRDISGNCPECGSDHYGTHPEFSRARPRCFSCGYPIRQSGTGMATRGRPSVPVKEARQIESARSNSFNIRNIVQHVHPQEG